MGNKSWKWFVFASILAAALWAAGSSKGAEEAQPKARMRVKYGVPVITLRFNGMTAIPRAKPPKVSGPLARPALHRPHMSRISGSAL